MRPTKALSDMEYWMNAVQYWKEKRDEYWNMDNSEGESRCSKRLFACELAYQEAQGLIEVYSGRANPTWTASHKPMAIATKPLGNRLATFSL